MKHWLKPLFLLLGLVAGSTVFAHENTPSEIPAVTQRCVTLEDNPPEDWTFEGTIVTYADGGVYGFRADTSSQYYIAFESEKQFAISGTFSPDGQWFVSFWGKRRISDAGDYDYYVSQLVITSTHPRRDVYLIPYEDVTILSLTPFFWEPRWLDNTHFVAYSGEDGYSEWFLVSPFEGKIQGISEEEGERLIQGVERSVSVFNRLGQKRYEALPEDPPQAFLFGKSPSILYITDPVTKQIYNTCLETSYGTVSSPSGGQIAVSLGNWREGAVYIVDLNSWTAYRLNLGTSSLITWVVDP